MTSTTFRQNLRKYARTPGVSQRAQMYGVPSNALKIVPKNIPGVKDIEIYIYTEPRYGRPAAIGFWDFTKRKSSKPHFFASYLSEKAREKAVRGRIEGLRQRMKEKMEERKRKKEFVHSVKVGDIFYTSWGYNQTNVDFYVVTKIKGKTAELEKIGATIDDERSGKGTDYVSPDPKNRLGKTHRVRIQPDGRGGSYVKVDGHYGHLWDGKPVYETAFGYGH